MERPTYWRVLLPWKTYCYSNISHFIIVCGHFIIVWCQFYNIIWCHFCFYSLNSSSFFKQSFFLIFFRWWDRGWGPAMGRQIPVEELVWTIWAGFLKSMYQPFSPMLLLLLVSQAHGKSSCEFCQVLLNAYPELSSWLPELIPVLSSEYCLSSNREVTIWPLCWPLSTNSQHWF